MPLGQIMNRFLHATARTLLLSGLMLASMAHATQFFILVPVQGRTAAPEVDIRVSLAGAALEAASTGEPYSADLAHYLSITGDPNLDAGEAIFSLEAAAPAGLGLSTHGKISGTPEEADPGFPLSVLVSYKSYEARQTYLLEILGKQFRASKVTAGFSHFCALSTQGGVLCWGENGYGQLGNGTFDGSDQPQQVVGLERGVRDVSAGGYHSCATLNDGRIACWGNNASGQLGLTGLAAYNEPVYTPASAIPGVAQTVVAGGHHTCVISASGGLWCWGFNGNGQLGNGGPTLNSVPTPVSGMSAGVTSVSLGQYHSCAAQSGAAFCWGSSNWGQQGGGGYFNTTTPAPVTGMATGVTRVATGDQHSCAVQGGALYCWGLNTDSQLGGGSVFQPTPVMVTGMSTGTQEVGTSGNSNFTCAIHQGAAKCWGAGAGGRLGHGSASASPTPSNVTGLASRVSSIATSSNAACAVQDGLVHCWGSGRVVPELLNP